VSFVFGTITSPTDFVAQFNEDIFNVPIASAASSVDVSPVGPNLDSTTLPTPTPPSPPASPLLPSLK